MSIEIRRENPTDIAAIESLTVAAFRDAAHTRHTEHFIVDALRKARQLCVSLVAEDDGVIVGHVAVSPVSVSGGPPGWHGLGRVSVMPQRQGQGIGSRLVRQALEELRGSGAAGCVVLGESAYYGRFGFETRPGFVLPGVPPHYFQALSFGGRVPAGTVSYHAAFNASR